jgi:hypothetical protein
VSGFSRTVIPVVSGFSRTVIAVDGLELISRGQDRN